MRECDGNFHKTIAEPHEYRQTLESMANIFAAANMGLPLLIFPQLFSKSMQKYSKRT